MEGNIVAVARALLHRDFHGQVDINLVAHLPLAVDDHIAGRALHDVLLDLLAVDGDLEFLACPSGMAHRNLILAAASHGHIGNRCLRCGQGRHLRVDVGEASLLAQSEVFVAEFAGSEEVHVQYIIAVVGIDEVTIFRVVLHARSHTAPHRLVHGGVDAVGLRAQRGEIDVAARERVLCGEDVVPHRVLIEVGIAGIVGAGGEQLAEFQHVIGVAALRTVGHVDIALSIRLRQEVLADAVATDADRTVLGHVLPKVLGSTQIVRGGGILFADALEADVLRHLRVGMAVVEERRVELLHAIKHSAMAETLGGGEVFRIAEELIGIDQRLVDAAMFAVEEALQVAVAHLRDEVHRPVGHLPEHLLGLLALAVEVGVAQTSQHLMLTVERHPAPVAANLREVAASHRTPRVVDGLATQEAVHALLVVVVGFLAIVEHVEHILHTLLQLLAHAAFVGGGIGQRECRHIVTAHVAIQVEACIATPVLEDGVCLQPTGIAAGVEPRLTHKRR